MILLLLKAHRPEGAPPSDGDRIEFTNDAHTDKGPATGTVAGVKMTVDGYYVTVKFSDAQESFSWDDISGGATKSGDLWMVKADIGTRYQRMLARRTGGDPAAMAAEDARLAALAERAVPGYTPPTATQKLSSKYPKPRQDWHGLMIAIEQPAGTVRSGVDETGRAWSTTFRYAYGEVIGSEGADGDPVDVFMGLTPDAPEVYVVRQMKRKQWDVYDEDKVFLDFDSMDSAKAAYLAHYDDPRFFGSIIAMPRDEFVKKVRATAKAPGMLKAIVFLRGAVAS